MSLVEYRRKRHFERTVEPAGKPAVPTGRSFCVQKHQASHLHYDFRIELNGVLKSWAVPKGPCLDPAVKRLAMHVEDHPVAYGTFEGTIPKGEYGGGTVMLWDEGEWEPLGDAEEGYRNGRLKFTLCGERLKGRWMLIRTARGKDQRQWLLFKERDDEARPLSDGDILDEQAVSVTTGRDFTEIAGGAARKRTAKRKTSKRTKTANTALTKRSRMPATPDVQLATLSKVIPDGEEWLHEIKFDGYRMLCRIEKGKVRFITRNHNDWTPRLKTLAKQVKDWGVGDTILDGEIVSVRPDGSTHFQDLQNAFRDRSVDALQYYVFDLLFHDGEDLRPLPLIERKSRLKQLVESSATPAALHYSDHFEGDGPAFRGQACERGLEGIISKRKDRPCQAGRGTDWLKSKCIKTGEFVIGGYTDPVGARERFGAILVGVHDDRGLLKYAGKVGTGFDGEVLESLFQQMQSLEQTKSPYVDLKSARSTHWLTPKLVAQVEYGSMTNDGILRHAAYQGLRKDKPAKQVTHEKAVTPSRVKAAAKQKTTAKRNADSKRPAPQNDYDASRSTFHGVRLTSPDKVLYPDNGLTKLDLARYLETMAPRILPHIRNRPLALVRCPEGQGGTCFFQKHPVAGTPDELRRVPVRDKDGTEDYVVVDDAKGLIGLAQIGVLEIHAWGSTADDLERPDRIIFDLDPDPSVAWPRVVQSTRQLRAFLQALGLESFLKTTGGKGLHLVVPMQRKHEWPEVKEFCHQVADAVVKADPARFTATMAKAARTGKIFIDYLRNDRGSTAVAPYSPRAKPGAPVSVPIDWKDLSPRLTSDHFTIDTAPDRLAKADPWAAFARTRQSLTRSWKRLKAALVSA